MEKSTPVIITEKISRRFGDIRAVEELSLEVQRGEVFGFLGPNGAGKTTTIRMLTCLIAPSEGKAVVNGYQVGVQDMQIRRSVGILTETPGLYNNLSAAHNLQIFADLYDVPDPESQIGKYLKMLGLWDRRHELAGTYSKGMKQKLAIVRALLHEPEVVFLDEPTAGLDPEAARLVRDFISGLRSQGRTIFLCTHNLDEADRLCDRIGLFKTRLMVVDTPDRLRSSVFGRKVVFHLAAVNETIANEVERLSYVSELEVVDNKLLLTVDDPEKRNPDIVKVLVEAGADIQFVGELRRSLEDVYLRLIDQS